MSWTRDCPAAIVFLGDLQAQRPLELELESIPGMTGVWFIHGNQDTDSDADYDHLFGSALSDRNLRGRVALVDGVRIAGLGGVFRGQVWTPPTDWLYESPQEFTARCRKGNRWRDGLPRKHRSSIFPEDYFRLVSQHADILVTHEALVSSVGAPEYTRLSRLAQQVASGPRAQFQRGIVALPRDPKSHKWVINIR